MSKSAVAIVNSRTAEREALADAVRLKDEAFAKRQRAAAELEEFEGKLRETSGNACRAEETLGEAKENLREALRQHGGNETAAVAHALRCGQVPYRDAVAEAERVYQKTEEALRLGKEGRFRFAGAMTAADEALRWAESRALKAAEAVLHTRLPVILAAAERARNEYLASQAVLLNVARDYDGVTSNTSSQEPLAVRIRSFLIAQETNDRTSAGPWVAAREALLTNPDAPLPE